MRSTTTFAVRSLATLLGLAFLATAPGAVGAASRHRALALAPAACAGHPVHYRREIVVLMFHALSPHPSTAFTITPTAFAHDLATMRAAGLCPVDLATLAAFVSKDRPVPPNAVLLTFDDGLESVFRYAYPILRRDRVPAAVFLIGSRVSQSHQTLTWTQVAAMARSGLVTFGGHTYALHHASATGPDTAGPAAAERLWRRGRRESWAQYDRRVGRDAKTLAALLARHLGAPSPYFAYPFGAYNPRLIHALAAVGFRYAFTTLPGAVRRGDAPERLPRIPAGIAGASPWQVVASVLYVAHVPVGQQPPPPASVMPVWPPVAVSVDIVDLSRWVTDAVSEVPHLVGPSHPVHGHRRRPPRSSAFDAAGARPV